MSIGDALTILGRAKAEYQRALTAADTQLRQAVRQDPANLGEARQVQSTYATGLTGEDLSAAVATRTPDPAPVAEPVADGDVLAADVRPAKVGRFTGRSKKDDE